MLTRARLRARKRGGQGTAAVLLALTIAGPGRAVAAPGPGNARGPDAALLPGHLAVVRASTLKHVRGKYMAPNGGIVYFGVSLSSTWKAGADSLTARLNLAFHPGDEGNVSVSGRVKGRLPPPDHGGSRSVEGPPPAGNIGQGVGQSIQVAGQGNSVHNRLSVDTASGPASGGDVAHPDLHLRQGCGSGCRVRLTATRAGVGLRIRSERGVVEQSISPGRITQSAQVSSDFNSIMNSLHVTIRRSQAGTINMNRAAQVLETLRGVR